jgi:hypothetical protein
MCSFDPSEHVAIDDIDTARDLVFNRKYSKMNSQFSSTPRALPPRKAANPT